MRSKLAGGVALGAAAAVCVGVAPAATAAPRVIYPKRGAAFVGLTSQKSGNLALPIDLRASANGQFMSRLDIQWGSACHGTAGAGSYGSLSVTLNKKIVPPGVFSDTNNFTKAFSDGSKGMFTIKLFGRFTSPLRVAGTFRVTLTMTDTTGATTNTCDSGVISWSATN